MDGGLVFGGLSVVLLLERENLFPIFFILMTISILLRLIEECLGEGADLGVRSP
jgi:hypothetical protein